MRTRHRVSSLTWSGVAAPLLLLSRLRGHLGQLPCGRDATVVPLVLGTLALGTAVWQAWDSFAARLARRRAGARPQVWSSFRARRRRRARPGRRTSSEGREVPSARGAWGGALPGLALAAECSYIR